MLEITLSIHGAINIYEPISGVLAATLVAVTIGSLVMLILVILAMLAQEVLLRRRLEKITQCLEPSSAECSACESAVQMIVQQAPLSSIRSIILLFRRS